VNGYATLNQVKAAARMGTAVSDVVEAAGNTLWVGALGALAVVFIAKTLARRRGQSAAA
jgi:hypothetical protein